MAPGADLQIVWFSLRIAALSTLLVFVPALLLAWWSQRWRGPAASFVEAVCSLPLVLPPTAVGFFLLHLLSRRGPLRPLLDALDTDLLFTPLSAVIASSVMSFPLVFVTFRAALESSDLRLNGIARTLGAGPVEAFLRVTVPLSWRGLVAGTLLGYCRAIGEFGATILIAGNIPGRTQTVAVAIYDRVQSGREEAAKPLLLFVVLLAFAAVMVVELLRYESRKRSSE